MVLDLLCSTYPNNSASESLPLPSVESLLVLQVRRRGDELSIAACILRWRMIVSRYIFVLVGFRLGSLVRCVRGMVGAFLGLPASSALVARITTVALRIKQAALATLGGSART